MIARDHAKSDEVLRDNRFGCLRPNASYNFVNVYHYQPSSNFEQYNEFWIDRLGMLNSNRNIGVLSTEKSSVPLRILDANFKYRVR